MAFFGALECASMSKFVKRMRTTLGSRSHVNPSTIFILSCESRQAINKHMLGPVCLLLEHFARSASVQTLVAQRRADLQHSDDVSMPHTLQLLEIIRDDLGLTIEVLQSTSSNDAELNITMSASSTTRSGIFDFDN